MPGGGLNGIGQKMPGIALQLSCVGVSYSRGSRWFRRDKFWALRDVSFDLYHGETLGIIGRNGAGKSTLLRVLSGIISPDRGIIKYYGDNRISLLSLQAGFVPYLTGRENIRLGGLLMGMTRGQIAASMQQIIEFSGLAAFIDQPISTYSSGMRARLGFALVFQADPQILLIDEVLGVGDTEFRKKSGEAMRQRLRSNKTIVLVSHSPATITQFCDRAVWIENGEKRMEGPATEVLACYEQQPGHGRLGRPD